MQINIPGDVLYIIDTLNKNGFEAYIVGGCVRDRIMGKHPMDWDIVTSALPLQVKSLFLHTFDTGIQHGTVTVVINGANFEVTTYRIDGPYTDGRRPESVSFDANLSDDLKRRDFTMNAMAYHPICGLVDPFDGISDIEKGVIMGVGDPDRRFQEDALRMLRAIRFSGQLGFNIEANTFEAISENAVLLRKISIERVRDEFTKLLCSDFPENMRMLFSTGLIYNWPIPLKLTLCNVEKAIPRLKDFSFEKNPQNCYAILLISWPLSGEDSVENFLRGLRFDLKTIRRTSKIVKWVNTPIYTDDYSLRVFLSGCGREDFDDVMMIKGIIYPDDLDYHKIAVYKSQSILSKGDCLDLRELAISGDDLVKLGISGEEIGVTLQKLLDAVLREPELNTKEALDMLLINLRHIS